MKQTLKLIKSPLSTHKKILNSSKIVKSEKKLEKRNQSSSDEDLGENISDLGSQDNDDESQLSLKIKQRKKQKQEQKKYKPLYDRLVTELLQMFLNIIDMSNKTNNLSKQKDFKQKNQEIENFMETKEINEIQKQPFVLLEMLERLFEKCLTSTDNIFQQFQQLDDDVNIASNDRVDTLKKLNKLENDYKIKLQHFQKQKLQMACLESRIQSLEHALDVTENKFQQEKQQTKHLQKKLDNIVKETYLNRNNSQGRLSSSSLQKQKFQQISPGRRDSIQMQMQQTNSNQKKQDNSTTKLRSQTLIEQSEYDNNSSQYSQYSQFNSEQKRQNYMGASTVLLQAKDFEVLKKQIANNAMISSSSDSKKTILQQYNQKINQYKKVTDQCYQTDINNLKVKLTNQQITEQKIISKNQNLQQKAQNWKQKYLELEKQKIEKDALNPQKNRSLTTYYIDKIKEKDKEIQKQKMQQRKSNIIQKKYFVQQQHFDQERSEYFHQIIEQRERIDNLLKLHEKNKSNNNTKQSIYQRQAILQQQQQQQHQNNQQQDNLQQQESKERIRPSIFKKQNKEESQKNITINQPKNLNTLFNSISINQ